MCICDVFLAISREGPIRKSQHISSVNDRLIPLYERATCVLSVTGLRFSSKGVAEAAEGFGELF